MAKTDDLSSKLIYSTGTCDKGRVSDVHFLLKWKDDVRAKLCKTYLNAGWIPLVFPKEQTQHRAKSASMQAGHLLEGKVKMNNTQKHESKNWCLRWFRRSGNVTFLNKKKQTPQSKLLKRKHAPVVLQSHPDGHVYTFLQNTHKKFQAGLQPTILSCAFLTFCALVPDPSRKKRNSLAIPNSLIISGATSSFTLPCHTENTGSETCVDEMLGLIDE